VLGTCTRKMSTACREFCGFMPPITAWRPCVLSTLDARLPTICSAPKSVSSSPTKLKVTLRRKYLRQARSTLSPSILPRLTRRHTRVMFQVDRALASANTTPMAEKAKPEVHRFCTCACQGGRGVSRGMYQYHCQLVREGRALGSWSGKEIVYLEPRLCRPHGTGEGQDDSADDG